MSVMETTTPTALAPSQWLTQNPQLAPTPLGAYTDSQYEAAAAQLRAQIARQYADLIQQIGYKNDSGSFIPGTVEAQAGKQKQELNYGMGLATEQDTQDHQRSGTLFSGRRGVTQARAQHPFISALADLDTQVPQTLARLYDQAAGLSDEYTRQNNILLADAAARAAAGFGTQPGQVVTAPGSTTQTQLAPGTVVPQEGTGNVFTGGVPGGVATADPEQQAFITGQSDINPFGAIAPARTTASRKPAPRIWGGQASKWGY